MNFSTLRIIGMIVFFYLGVVVSMDEYGTKTHIIDKGETIDEIIDDYFADEKTEDAQYRLVLKDMMIEWNPHVQDWDNLPPGVKIYVTRPKSPFMGKY